MTDAFAAKVRKYFSEHLEWGPVEVADISRLATGASRETWRVSVKLTGRREADATRDIILQLDPATTLIDANRNVEYAMYRAFEGVVDVPVPAVICYERDRSHLGTAFMATTALPGTSNYHEFLSPPLNVAGPRFAGELFRVLGAMTLVAPAERGLLSVISGPSPESAWLGALSHWVTILQRDSLGPSPIINAAIRYLKRSPPPAPKRITVVHGDYRWGNVLVLPDGAISGVLDWEMAHLGDPLEDLAWVTHHFWRQSAAPTKVAGYLDEDEAIKIWQAASGLKVDPVAFAWWKLFTSVKHVALISTGAANFLRTKSANASYAAYAWLTIPSEEAVMMDLMGVGT